MKQGQYLPPGRVQPCGTDAGYHRHLHHKEPPCDPCSAAHSLESDRRAYERYAAYLARGAAVGADLRQLIGLVTLAVTTPPGNQTPRTKETAP